MSISLPSDAVFQPDYACSKLCFSLLIVVIANAL